MPWLRFCKSVKLTKEQATESRDRGANNDGSELNGWFDSLQPAFEFLLKRQEPTRTTLFLDKLLDRLRESGLKVPHVVSTPYINTIPVEEQVDYPGDWQTEVRIKSFIRWNAMAMVVNANHLHDGLGGHISTFASCATLYEVGFNHFFRARHGEFPGDMIYFQGHASPGIYARAF